MKTTVGFQKLTQFFFGASAFHALYYLEVGHVHWHHKFGPLKTPTQSRQIVKALRHPINVSGHFWFSLARNTNTQASFCLLEY